jgi:hypothetical protein
MAARRPEERSNSSLEFVWVRLNGGDTTIEAALRTIQERRNASNQRRQLEDGGKRKALTNGKSGDTKDGDPDVAAEDPSLWDQDEDEIVGELVDPDSSAPTDARPPKGKRRLPSLPKGLPDLDLSSETPTFRDYVAEKKPKDQFDWYLLVAAWLKTYKKIEEISLRHIVTAKQYIGADWGSLPEDAGQPFRDGRRASHGIFEKGSKNGLSKITKVGEDRVARMGQ